jgi:uncharacterized protein YdeI (BOF family)
LTNYACLTTRPLPDEIYPKARFCGGRGGAESIEQARVISQLGGGYSGTVSPDVQWEVKVWNESAKAGYADLTYYNHTEPPSSFGAKLQVYELKQTSDSTYGEVADQLGSYVNALAPVTAGGAQPGVVLGGWHDSFLVATGSCGTTLAQYTRYLAWQSEPGVISIWSYVPQCFDPQTEPVPKPVEVPVFVPPITEWGENPSTPPMFPGEPYPGPPGGPPVPIPTPAPGPPGPEPGPGGGGGEIEWPPPPTYPPGGLYGEPHLPTFDGFSYNMQSVGEFDFAAADDYGIDVQARFEPFPGSQDFSVASAGAFTLDGHVIELDRPNVIGRVGGTKLLIDGAPYELAQGSMLNFGDGALLVHKGGEYFAAWPGTGDRPMVWFSETDEFRVYVPRGTSVSGLLGNADGDPNNDLVTADGQQLPPDVDQSTIDGTFADSWRITHDESLFTYAQGQSTSTFTDYSFPSEVVTIHDLSPSALAEATAQCNAAQVLVGPQFDDCLLDWAETQESNFLESAVEQTMPLTAPGAKSVDASGHISENFDDAVPTNFVASRYGSGTGSEAFAGPFAPTEPYSFYVSQLPAHDSVALSFDVITFGDWRTESASDMISVQVGGQTVWTGAVATGAPTASGTTSSGTPYAVYPVSLNVPHSSSELGVQISATVPLASGQAFGIDDVTASLDLVTPQYFDVPLPLSASNGVPALGAGNLETTGSEDAYRFITTAPGGLQLELTNCASSLNAAYKWVLNWSLIDEASGATVQSGAGCASQVIPSLPAGSYRLAITDNGTTGTYALNMYQQPPPDTLSVSLPASISNGLPTAGAGNLETTSSEDDYTFSTAAPGGVQLDFSGCSSSLSFVNWALIDASSGSTVTSGLTCSSKLVANVPAGQYRLAITRNGRAGTYHVAISLQPTPQYVAVSLPASISDGVPVAGAGNLETTSSEDDYTFSTTATGGVQLDFSSCSSGLPFVSWSLVDTTSGSVVKSGSTCASKLIAAVPAGQYRLAVTRNGATGTYKLGISIQPPADTFNITLPASISNGLPTAGAGNLETTSSEDDYTFSTAAPGGVQLDFSGCSSSLSFVNWALIDASSGSTVKSGLTCSSQLVSSLPAGQYRLAITRNGYLGTYKVSVYVQPPPDTFNVTLPASISNGVPATGAGNLETTSSEDDYTFTTTATGGVQMDFSTCSSSLTALRWSIVNASSGSTVKSGSGCTGGLASNLPAAQYRLIVTDNGDTGTYKVSVYVQPPPNTFNVTLPASISNGVPATGAGNLETTSSEDDYTFSTTATGGVQLDFSSCSSGLSPLDWSLLDTTSGSAVKSGSTCASTLIAAVPAGQYRLVVTRNGATGTYKLAISIQPPPDTFNVALPASISNGVPAAGAGNLETTFSEDDYTFSTTATGGVQLDFSTCSSGLSPLSWTLVTVGSGTTFQSGTSSCASKLIAAVPAGQYRLAVTRNGATGTYKLGISIQPPADTFNITLPAAISSGVPGTGAGNLETTSSEDDYTFSTTATGGVQLDFSGCSSSLTFVNWALIDATSGSTVRSGLTCSSQLVPSLPAGQYRLAITRNGYTGTYKVPVSVQPPPDTFNVTLPASISSGVPATGAGNLETTSSEDDYTFTTTSTSSVKLGFSGCSSSLIFVNWALIDTSSGSTVKSGLTCGSQTVNGVPAGQYRLALTRDGYTGTYKLSLSTG